MRCNCIIVACGGKAFPNLGSDGSCFPILEKLGHKIIPIRPALTPILAEMKNFKMLSGIRAHAQVTLFIDGRICGSTTGNLIFTDFGLNGPAVMDLSYLVNAAIERQKNPQIKMNLNCLLPIEDAFYENLKQIDKQPLPIENLLLAFFPKRLSDFILKLSGLSREQKINETTKQQIELLIQSMQTIEINIKGVKSFTDSQITSGGIALDEVEPNLMSKKVRGLYLAGEALNVNGPCGGYNLYFAFSSGALAGDAVAQIG
jgi:predicted Rossmann fold flavoprotein